MSMKKLGDALCDAVERGDWDAMQVCAEAWRNAKPAAKKKENPETDFLTGYFLSSMGQGNKLLCSAASVRPHIAKLLKAVSPENVKKSIDWLASENPKSDYPLVVLSGKSLYEKWDKIQYHMGKTKRTTKVEYF